MGDKKIMSIRMRYLIFKLITVLVFLGITSFSVIIACGSNNAISTSVDVGETVIKGVIPQSPQKIAGFAAIDLFKTMYIKHPASIPAFSIAQHAATEAKLGENIPYLPNSALADFYSAKAAFAPAKPNQEGYDTSFKNNFVKAINTISNNPGEYDSFMKDLREIPVGIGVGFVINQEFGEELGTIGSEVLSKAGTSLINNNLDRTQSPSISKPPIEQFSESGQKKDLGGINFTSIKLNYISVNTDSSGGVNFDLIFKAKKADRASPGTDLINSIPISATAFMTGLAVPDNKFWVNLNPWESDRIIDEQLRQSEVGRIMLEADLQMKKDFSNYGNPCANETGKVLWNLLDKKREALTQQCMEKFPGEIKDINNVWFLPVTRHWIVPDKVYAYTNGTQIYIINATLTINSEPVANHSSFRVDNQDMATLSKGCLEELNKSAKEYGEYDKDLNDRMIQPYVVADVNHGGKYEDLRDVYVALSLAQWYKTSITSHMDIFRETLDSSNSTVLKSMKPWSSNEIWDKYVYSFKNGEYNCWENTTTKTAKGTYTQSSSRSAGGVDFYSIKDHLVEIEGMPPVVQEQINRAIMNGYTNEGKDTLFGNRLYVYLRQDTPVSSSSSHVDPDLARTWNNKGVSLNGQGKIEKAIEAYDEAIGLDPNLVEAWQNKGSALNNQGKYDEAIKAHNEAIRLASKDSNIDRSNLNSGIAKAWYNKGVALHGQGKLDKAIEAYDEAIRLDPNLAEAWQNKGSALNNQGKYDEAIKAYDEAIKLNPNDSSTARSNLISGLAKAWYNKGVTLHGQGKFDEAIKAYDEAIRLDPNLTEARKNKDSALNSQAKHDEAIEAGQDTSSQGSGPGPAPRPSEPLDLKQENHGHSNETRNGNGTGFHDEKTLGQKDGSSPVVKNAGNVSLTTCPEGWMGPNEKGECFRLQIVGKN